jgi:anti-sigma factor RsiW
MAMAMSCEQIDAQLLDFLYGELPPGERAAFAAHVAGCDRCRREVESFGHTRTVARAVLDEAPPAHLRARIVSAARAAARAEPGRAPVVPARASLWDRVRGYWALPTLATVGALAVFLLGSRLFLNPRDTLVRGRSVVGARAPGGAREPGVREAPAAAPAAEPQAPLDQDRGSAEAGGRLDPARAEPSAQPGPGTMRAKAHRRAGGGASNRSSARLEGLADDAFGAASGAGSIAASPAKPAAPVATKKSVRANAGPAPDPREKAFETADEPRVPFEGRADLLERSGAAAPAPSPPAPPPPRAPASAPAFASPPAPAPRFASPPPSASAGAAPVARGRLADEAPASDRRAQPRDRLQAKEETTPAPRPSRPSAARVPALAPPQAEAETEVGSRDRANDKSSSKDKDKDKAKADGKRVGFEAAEGAKGGAPRAETLVQRADRLFTDGRWVEAAVAYRDLLRQQPNAPDAGRWRQRLVAAEAATATGRPPASR